MSLEVRTESYTTGYKFTVGRDKEAAESADRLWDQGRVRKKKTVRTLLGSKSRFVESEVQSVSESEIKGRKF